MKEEQREQGLIPGSDITNYDYRISIAKDQHEENFVQHFYLNLQNNDFKKDINKNGDVQDIHCN